MTAHSGVASKHGLGGPETSQRSGHCRGVGSGPLQGCGQRRECFLWSNDEAGVGCRVRLSGSNYIFIRIF